MAYPSFNDGEGNPVVEVIVAILFVGFYALLALGLILGNVK